MAKAATLLFAHGGGFCKETWEPVLRRLKEAPLLQGAVRTEFVSFDFKYHGSNRDESVEAEIDRSNPMAPRVHHPAADLTAWTSADVLQQAQALRSKSADTPLIGIGHSMGASAMWNTEAKYPGTFDGLVLFEPVYGPLNSDVATFLVSITLARESSWPSRAAAEEHLRGFKNFAAWDRGALDAYMNGALVEDEATGKTVLACSTAIEASLYCHKLLNLDDQQLARPQCKVFFQYASRTKMFLPPLFQELCDKWPSIYSLDEPIDNSSHAMIMEKPAEVAQKIVDCLQQIEPFADAAQDDVASASRLLPSQDNGGAAREGANAAFVPPEVGEEASITAAEERSATGDLVLTQNLSREPNQDVKFALDHTFLIQAHNAGIEAFPRSPWNCETSISHSELVHHVIERLLARKRAMNWEDANILTLGYREVTPGASGHLLTQSHAIMSYYPNTLVAALKKPTWEALHQLMGDDLMTHLLLNYTILVQLKDSPLSYMQLTGKSLRQRNRIVSGVSDETAKREVSINHVMYARYFQRDRVFASSHALVKASKTGDPISRTEASRVLRVIFPGAADQKRLPKRLINLIPTIQSMVLRFKACGFEDLARKLVPVNADFRKFMAETPSIKRKLVERTAESKVSSQPLILPIVHKALEDGYLSQSEAVAPSSDRKRKRREEAIDGLSSASTGSVNNGSEKSGIVEKKRKHTDASSTNIQDGSRGVSDVAKLQQHKETIKTVLAFKTPKRRVYRLVRKLVATVVPKEIWGSADSKNWKCVKTMLRKLVFSRKFDVFSLKKCAEEFQVTHVDWMNVHSKNAFCPPNERSKRHQLFESLLWWVISSLVCPVLQNLFYITEAEGMANEIAFYQRPVWNVISTLALDDLEGGILQPSSNQPLPASRVQQLATSRLRLLPKSSGVRPLMNLSKAVDQDKVSVNRSMDVVHRVLTFEMERQPKRLLGASVRNMDEIYTRVKPLFRQIASCPRCAERQRASWNAPSAYCVTVDVERCFDTIKPRKLYQVLKKAIREEEYLIRKHWVGHQVAAVSSSTKTDESLPSSSFFFKMERPAYPSGDFVGFDELAARSKKKNAMFVDGVLYDYLTKAKALELLKEHLFSNVVQIDGHDYVQRCGIPQGSVLSTTLCNMYYAHFERRVLRKRLPEVCDPVIVPVSCCQHEELLRYTDDFMFITTDVKRARRFFDVMHEGNEEYGCFVNIAKSQANFETGQALHSESQRCIPWCGMLIDPSSLQLYVNYDKLSSALLKGSIPFNETKAAQDFLVNKVISPIRQRWHALFFDPELLVEDVIRVNTFQMLVVAAQRFSILIEMLPFVNRDMHFFHECIHRILKKMVKGIDRSLQLALEAEAAPTQSSRASRASYQARKHQVWSIGLYAFHLVIQAKREQVKTARAGRQQCPWMDWQKLLDAVQTEREAFKRRGKKAGGMDAGQSCAVDFCWLLHDHRNAAVLKQCLQLGCEDVSVDSL